MLLEDELIIVRQGSSKTLHDLNLSSGNKKDLNDVTAAPFLVFFLLLAAERKTPKTGQL